MTKVKILVATHKPCQVYHDNVYIPIHVGKAQSIYNINWLGDNTGENISNKNSMYCEMTAHYWAWKNLKDVDYIGLCHYRRYFNKLITNENIEYILKGHDVILPAAIHRTTALSYKLNTLTGEDVCIFFKVIEQRFPQYYDTAINYIMNNNRDYAFNMVICSHNIYNQMMSFIFGVLFECEKYIRLQPYTNGRRIFGYLSEYLMPIFILKHHLKIRELPLVQMLNEKPLTYLTPQKPMLHNLICDTKYFLSKPRKRINYTINPSLKVSMQQDGILDKEGNLVAKD